MKLKSVVIENYRAIEHLHLPLDPSLTVLHGDNTCGKTSVLSAIAVGLGVIPDLLANESGFKKSGVDFLETDLRVGESFLQVDVTSTEGLAWKRERFVGMDPEGSATKNHGLEALNKWMTELVYPEKEATRFSALPIVAFYDTDRAVSDIPDGWRDRASDVRSYAVKAAKDEALSHVRGERMFSRYKALEGALTARAKFHQLFQWFRDKEDEELREQKKRRNFDYRQNDLSAVRNAISAMLDGVSDPHIDVQPLRFSVAVDLEDGRVDTLEIDQLSDGQRAVLALAADLAWRMAQGNPHLQDALTSEAIVLIDEVEIHLHPSWQQRILNDLRRTFPNAQFIVSTHSPQVLTTIEPETHRRTRSGGRPHRCRIGGRMDVRCRGGGRAVGGDGRERAARQPLYPHVGSLQATSQRRPGRIRGGPGAQTRARRIVGRRPGPRSGGPGDPAAQIVPSDGQINVKAVRTLQEPTRGLRDYLEIEAETTSWTGFRAHDAGGAYQDLIAALTDLQHGLCGYCEIDLTARDHQVEHVIPQSDPAQGAARALDVTNLIACCKGGTVRYGDADRYLKPGEAQP